MFCMIPKKKEPNYIIVIFLYNFKLFLNSDIENIAMIKIPYVKKLISEVLENWKYLLIYNI